MLPDGHDILPGVDGQLSIGRRPTFADEHWAKITGSAGHNPILYAWKEQTWQVLPPGSVNAIGLADMDGGLFGTAAHNPAVDPNNGQINNGDFVRVKPAYFDPVYDMVFAITGRGGSGGGNVGGGVTILKSVVTGISGQIVQPNSWVPVIWGQISLALSSPFFDGNFPDRFTIPMAGVPLTASYVIFATAWIHGVNIGYDYYGDFAINGILPTGNVPWEYGGICSGTGVKVSQASVLVMGRGDYIQFYTRTDAGSATNIDSYNAGIILLGP